MYKTVSISIGGTLFVIEEAAYKTLDSYLTAIRAHFAKSADADEIVEDIESRAAEEFHASLTGKKKTIVQKDIDEFIRTMGTVEDFKTFDEEEKTTGTTSEASDAFDWSNIRLYRDADDQVIGGVASGIANYFGIDPLIVRLLFLVSLFMGGFGVIAYILMWILVPEARTAAEKVEMTGGRVTLSSIQEKIDQALPPEKKRSAIRSIAAAPVVIIRTLVRGIGNVIKFIFPIIGRLIGIVLIVATAFAIAMLTFTALSLLLNPTSPYIGGFPLYETIGWSYYAALLIAGYFIGLIPLIVILLVGASLASMRFIFTAPAALTLGALWMVAFVTAGATGFSVGPQLEVAIRDYEQRYQQTTTKTFDVDDFTGITIGGRNRLEVIQGNTSKVEVEGSQEMLASLNATVEEGLLSFEHSDTSIDRCIFFCTRSGMTVRLTMPTAPKVQLTGGSSMSMEGFEEGSWEFDLSGRSFADVEGEPDEVLVTLNGASNIHLRGTGSKLTIRGNGASDVSASEFRVKTADVNLSGASQAFINVQEELTAVTSGASHVMYVTEPAKKTVESSGHSFVGIENEGFYPPEAPHFRNPPFSDESTEGDEW